MMEKKYSGRLNADYQATDALKFETSMSYDKRDIITPTTDVGAGYFDPWFGLCIIKMVRLMIHLVVTGILLVG